MVLGGVAIVSLLLKLLVEQLLEHDKKAARLDQEG
jgi:sulfate transport system permease protein